MSFRKCLAERKFNIRLLLKGDCDLISKAMQTSLKEKRTFTLLRDSQHTLYSFIVLSIFSVPFFIYNLSPLVGKRTGTLLFFFYPQSNNIAVALIYLYLVKHQCHFSVLPKTLQFSVSPQRFLETVHFFLSFFTYFYHSQT